jgi:mannose-1-phosphate guanylyltransferase / mannose-6-phosphate isomerase
MQGVRICKLHAVIPSPKHQHLVYHTCNCYRLAMTNPLIPVILSGGAGTRLWPLSRSAAPKQFLRLVGEHTLLEQTLMRCRGPMFDAIPIVVGSTDHRGQLLETLLSVETKADLLLEPCRRNSCAAVVAGALRAIERDPNAVILVLAADHHIPDTEDFHEQIAKAAEAACQGALVTFGIQPSHPATGYGYILSDLKSPIGPAFRIAKFVEKPDAITAKNYLEQGYLWNSGNFLFQAQSLLDEAQRLCPDVVAHVSQSMINAERDQDFIRLSTKDFASAPSVAIDVAIMEQTDRSAVLPVAYRWSDIGTWDAVAQAVTRDANDNAIIGQGVVLNSNNVVVNSSDLMTAVVGCEDIMVITTPTAVLVVKRGSSENVKMLLGELQNKNRSDLM